MCVAAQLGVGMGITPPEVPGQVMDAVAALGLPTHISCDWETIVEAIGLDKKGTGSQISLILLEKMGSAMAVKLEKEAVLQNLEAIYGR